MWLVWPLYFFILENPSLEASAHQKQGVWLWGSQRLTLFKCALHHSASALNLGQREWKMLRCWISKHAWRIWRKCVVHWRCIVCNLRLVCCKTCLLHVTTLERHKSVIQFHIVLEGCHGWWSNWWCFAAFYGGTTGSNQCIQEGCWYREKPFAEGKG